MSMTPYCGRFAPSPTGPLHPGSLLAALGSWLLARHAGGRWLLRIEDIDPPRTVPGAAEQQLAALAALGLAGDGPVVRQSQREALYQAAVDRLLAQGKAFACACSRRDLADQHGIHHRCVARSTRSQAAIRLRVAPGSVVGFDDGLRGRIEQDVHAQLGDFVLRRADGYWAYQLAVVVDDGAQGVTEVVRGADLLDSTPRQILLQRALGLPTPAYLHLPLLLDAHGRKLSKSDAAAPLDPARPLPALRQAWAQLGQDPQLIAAATDVPATLAAAQAGFDPARLPRTDLRLPACAPLPPR
ncbi:tRNA glutamyl-Q(34) synthetase GluQRS [Stenotrophomonas rhizophila]|uniref:tRNA glutamyl-Q(34) synthetase GluQRS n=1 Tax=Stenotrophomonas rhizophila TaxID=216778 RepID=UPI001E55DAAC|nr:tRNA glutamyl-Q(34) synthetase GluQRS [Stenotrophomonas rhizophila]MCC7632964.1 tRNA glutamyl-Q(34) synthetase GluQRS [Stenotrophomonas rhizophila]MCC7662311.1 tRNA glutamyl-Q(34) synthetase GluQRS [Stenotrophomonas rhizophila]